MLRDEGMERVADNAEARRKWFSRAQILAMQVRSAGLLPHTWIGEDLRIEVMKLGIELPHHHNVWGSLCRKLGADGLCEKTGDPPRNMATARSHRRLSIVWRWTNEPRAVPGGLPRVSAGGDGPARSTSAGRPPGEHQP